MRAIAITLSLLALSGTASAHSLGFAGALREVGLPEGHTIGARLGFHDGVDSDSDSDVDLLPVGGGGRGRAAARPSWGFEMDVGPIEGRDGERGAARVVGHR